MRITRHFVDVGARRVHYRLCGIGPPLLLIHQSPRSSAEYALLMAAWGAHFSCIAPDTPGFGQSDPLPPGDTRAEIEDFADAAVAFLDAIGVGKVCAYGYHSGAITLITALKRHPDRFSAVAANGYAVWNENDLVLFGDAYTPPFQPQPYGEHLVWLWNRILEQTWFFPWNAVTPDMRLSIAHDDPGRTQTIALEMLESGDAYRHGYGAVLRANRDLPAPGARNAPTAIVASRADPLGAHMARLGPLPDGWSATLYDTPAEAEAAALAHVRAHPAPGLNFKPRACADEGFVEVDGMDLHWRGLPGAPVVHLHDVGSSGRALGAINGLSLDLPGHGLSSPGPVDDSVTAWADIVVRALSALGIARPTIVGHGWSALLALVVAARTGGTAEGWNAHIPRHDDDGAWLAWFSPDRPARFGEHLTCDWAKVRAETFFWPPFAVTADRAVPFDPADATPERLRERHLARTQAPLAGGYAHALISADRAALLAAAPPSRWHMPAWARDRADVWKPEATHVEYS